MRADAPWLVLVATTAVNAMASMAALTPSAVAPEIGAALGLSPALVGVQISLVYGAAAAASLVAGPAVRRRGAARTSQFAMLLVAIGCALLAIPAPVAMAAGSLVLGWGYGLTNPAASHLLFRFGAGRRRNLIFSLKQTGVPLGGIGAGLVAPPLALAFGWQAAPAAAAVVALALAVALQSVRRVWDDDCDPSAAGGASPLEGLRMVWRRPALRGLSAMGFCFSLVQLCLSAFTVSLLVEDIGLGLVAAGTVMALVQAAGVAGRVGWGWVADRVGDGLAILVGVGLVAAASIATVTAMGPGWPLAAIAAVFVAAGITAIGWNGVYLAEVARLAPPGEVGRATGGSLAVTFAGVLVGPSMVTVLHGGLDRYTLSFAFVAAVAAAGAGAVAWARRSQGCD